MSAVALIRDSEAISLSLELPKGQSFEEWSATGRELASASKVLNWWIGDWWAAGSHRYGERAKVAAEGIFGREFSTIASMASVCRAFETCRRRQHLSFTHHQEVAALSPAEADRLLDQAERHEWSVRDLREAVADRREPRDNVRPISGERAWERTKYDRSAAKEAIFERLNEAAETGRLCPTADDLQEVSGVASVSTTVALMHSLEHEQKIKVERFQRSRIVTIVETGKSTATPNDQTPHWRGQPRDVPTPTIESLSERRPDVTREILLEAHRLGKAPAQFLVDLVLIGWDVWSERSIQLGASEGIV